MAQSVDGEFDLYFPGANGHILMGARFQPTLLTHGIVFTRKSRLLLSRFVYYNGIIETCCIDFRSIREGNPKKRNRFYRREISVGI